MHPLTPAWYRPRPDLKKMDPITANFNEISDGVKVIKNWLSEEEIKVALSIINNYDLDQSAERKYSITDLKDYVLTDIEAEFSKKIADKILDTAKDLYQEDLIVDGPFLYAVHPTGSFLDPHTDIDAMFLRYTDKETWDEQIKEYPYLWSGHCTTLVYLNSDFEGGELYFPELDFDIKPEPGMLVMFPGNLHYVHGIAKVSKGTRYTLGQWLKFMRLEKELKDLKN